MLSADDPMAGVTEQTVTLQVTPGQYAQLEQDRVLPGRVRVTHKVSVGPFVLPGLYVVTSTQRHQDNKTVCYVTLSKLED